MREWLLLGVLAVGGILGIWLLFFKSLAALYELWQSGREFEKLKREAASRRMQRPSELMQKKQPLIEDNDSDTPVIPQAMLDSLSDDEADPRLVPQKKSSTDPGQQPAESTPQIESQPEVPPAESPRPPSPAATEQVDPSTTSTPPPPTFPLPSADDSTPEAEQPESKPPESPSPSEAPNPEQHPPRYD